jgi:hypothetical protein
LLGGLDEDIKTWQEQLKLLLTEKESKIKQLEAAYEQVQKMHADFLLYFK